MIKEITMYTVVCDNCGADSNAHSEYAGYSDSGYAEDVAMDSDWLKENGKHYCTNCFSYDNNDELVIDATRRKTPPQEGGINMNTDGNANIEKSLEIFMSEQKMQGFTYEEEVTKNKQLRKDTDDIIQRIKDLPPSRERSISITKLQEGVMWLGMDLKRLGETNPYPSSKDASTGIAIEPTADGLKM